jgi:hypothetical protein
VTAGTADTEHPEDVGASLRVGRRGQRSEGGVWEAFLDLPEGGVLGAKVVAPLGHTMRFVDCEQGDVDLLESGEKTGAE